MIVKLKQNVSLYTYKYSDVAAEDGNR